MSINDLVSNLEGEQPLNVCDILESFKEKKPIDLKASESVLGKYYSFFNRNPTISELVKGILKWITNDTFESFSEIFPILIKASREKGEWFLKIAKWFALNSKLIAIKESRRIEKKVNAKNNTPLITLPSKIEKSAEDVRSLLGFYQASKTDRTMKKGILFTLNELFWIFFKLVNYNQCRSFIKLVNDSLKGDLSFFTKSEIATYYYYCGRMSLFESFMKKASIELSESFNICSSYKGKNAFQIKRQILKYLIPVNIYCGKFPTRELLEHFKLKEYIDLSISIQSGNQELFQKQIDNYKRLWIKRGLFLTMEKLRLLLIRNLFKKIFVMSRNSLQTVQFDVEFFQNALNWNSKMKYDVDEVEGLIANLIFKHYVKGYISHEKRKIVFSKDNAFVPIPLAVSKQ